MAHRLPGILLSTTRVAATAWLAIAIVLALGQRYLVFPGAFGGAVPDIALPPDIATVTVDTPDGVALRALWKAPGPGCGVVLSFHGNGDGPETAAARFGAGRWAEDGWGLLAVAYRGYPGSGGHVSGAGIAIDAAAAYDVARRMAPGAPVLAHGHSMGSWAALNAAVRGPVSGVYLEAPFTSMLSVASGRYPWLPVSLLLLDPMRSDLLADDIAAPVAIVHGNRDDIVPMAQGKALAGLLVRAGVDLDVVPADHVTVYGSRDAALEPRFAALAGGCAASVPLRPAPASAPPR